MGNLSVPKLTFGIYYSANLVDKAQQARMHYSPFNAATFRNPSRALPPTHLASIM
jgi:hypothetical protein